MSTRYEWVDLDHPFLGVDVVEAGDTVGEPCEAPDWTCRVCGEDTDEPETVTSECDQHWVTGDGEHFYTREQAFDHAGKVALDGGPIIAIEATVTHEWYSPHPDECECDPELIVPEGKVALVLSYDEVVVLVGEPAALRTFLMRAHNQLPPAPEYVPTGVQEGQRRPGR